MASPRETALRTHRQTAGWSPPLLTIVGTKPPARRGKIRLSPRRKPETSASSSSKTANLPGSLRRDTESEPRDSRPTLADVGIDKKLSARSQKVGGIGEASAFQNGIYTVTTAGSGSAPWVLTRASC